MGEFGLQSRRSLYAHEVIEADHSAAIRLVRGRSSRHGCRMKRHMRACIVEEDLNRQDEMRNEEHRKPEDYCPWEDTSTIGLWKGFKSTVKSVLLSTEDFFSQMPRSAGYKNPTLFFLITTLAALLAQQLWTMSHPFCMRSTWSP